MLSIESLTSTYISTGEAGTWASSNEKVLTVDRLSGHGLALAPGTVSVSYNMSSQITTVQVGCNIFNSLFHVSYELFIASLCYNIEITKMRIFFQELSSVVASLAEQFL